MSILSLYEPKNLPKLDNMVSQMIPNDQTIFGFPYSSNLRRIVVLMQQMDVRCHRKRFVKDIIHRVWFSDMVYCLFDLKEQRKFQFNQQIFPLI